MSKKPSRKERAVAALHEGLATGRFTVEEVSAAVSRGPDAVCRWVAQANDPPTTVLPALEAFLSRRRK